MPVAGLVIQLANDERLARDAIAVMENDRAITLGEPPAPGRIPVVMESDDEEHSRRQLKWLERLPGIASVLVVSVDCSDLAVLDQPDSGRDKGDSSS